MKDITLTKIGPLLETESTQIDTKELLDLMQAGYILKFIEQGKATLTNSDTLYNVDIPFKMLFLFPHETRLLIKALNALEVVSPILSENINQEHIQALILKLRININQ